MNSGEHIERVDPQRLASGNWCHRAQKTLGQGDIAASYSADRIGMDEPVRAPFEWKGCLWVCVALHGRSGAINAQAYRLVDPRIFEGKAMSYGARVRDGDASRRDPCGFYHGMSVKFRKERFVLCGPPVSFAAGEKQQLALF